MERNEDMELENSKELNMGDILKAVKKNLFFILTITLLFFCLAIGFAYSVKDKSLGVSGAIGLNFKEIEVGKNPDGTSFEKSSLVPEEIMKQVYEKYDLKKEFSTFEKFKDELIVIPEVPTKVNREIHHSLDKGIVDWYSPKTYSIYIFTSNGKKVRNAIDELIEKGSSGYRENYFPDRKIQEIDLNSKEIANLDYNDFLLLMEEKIKNMESVISDIENDEINSKDGNLNTMVLKNSLENFKYNEFSSHKEYMNSNLFSKDIEKFKKNNTRKIGDIEIKKEQSKLKANHIWNILNIYKPVGEKDDYYIELIKDYRELQDKILDYDEEIRNIKNFTKNSVQINLELDKNLLETQGKLAKEINEYINKVNDLNQNFISMKYADMVRVVTPAMVDSQMINYKIIIVLGLVIGLILGVILAPIKEFYLLRKKSSKKVS